MKKVIDSQSNGAKEIPNINDVNPTSDICAVIEDLCDSKGDEEEEIFITVIGDWSENGIEDGRDQRMLRTRAESLYKTIDC